MSFLTLSDPWKRVMRSGTGTPIMVLGGGITLALDHKLTAADVEEVCDLLDMMAPEFHGVDRVRPSGGESVLDFLKRVDKARGRQTKELVLNVARLVEMAVKH